MVCCNIFFQFGIRSFIRFLFIDIPWIVGSIGPYGAHLHDGSEYTGTYADVVSKDTIKKWHRPRLNAVIEAGVDALAIETIPCLVCELIFT